MSSDLPIAAPAGQIQGSPRPIHPCPTLREPLQGTMSRVPFLLWRSKHRRPMSHAQPRCPSRLHASPSNALEPHVLGPQMCLPNSANPKSNLPNAGCSKASAPRSLSMWTPCQKGPSRWGRRGLGFQRRPSASGPRPAPAERNARRIWTKGLPSAGPNASDDGRQRSGLKGLCTSRLRGTKTAAPHPSKAPLGRPMLRLAMRPLSRHVAPKGCRPTQPACPSPKPAMACAWTGWGELALKSGWIP